MLKLLAVEVLPEEEEEEEEEERNTKKTIPCRRKRQGNNSIEDFVHGYSLPWELETISLTSFS